MIATMTCPNCSAALAVYRESWRCNLCGLTSDTQPRVAQDLGDRQNATAPRETDKGNFALLKNKQHVNLDTTARYLGISRRAVELAVNKGKLTAIGNRQNRRITVDSLVKYLPPSENTN